MSNSIVVNTLNVRDAYDLKNNTTEANWKEDRALFATGNTIIQESIIHKWMSRDNEFRKQGLTEGLSHCNNKTSITKLSFVDTESLGDMSTRVAFMESYLLNNESLLESNDTTLLTAFRNLPKQAAAPEVGTSYLIIGLYLINDTLGVTHQPCIAKLLEINDDSYVLYIPAENRTVKLPEKTLSDVAPMVTLLFNSIVQYDKLRTFVVLKFGINLPEYNDIPIKENKMSNNMKGLRESSIMKGIVDEDGASFVIYINGKPATKYVNSKKAEAAVSMMKSKFPDKKFEIKHQPEGHASDAVDTLYINDKPSIKYRDPDQTLAAMELLRKKHPSSKYDLKPEVREAQADAHLLKRITVKKHGGNDENSWAVFIDGKPAVTGLNKRSVPHYKSLLLKKLKEKPSLTGSSEVEEARGSGVMYIVKSKDGVEKAFKNLHAAEDWKNSYQRKAPKDDDGTWAWACHDGTWTIGPKDDDGTWTIGESPDYPAVAQQPGGWRKYRTKPAGKLSEGEDTTEAVANAIIRRITTQYLDVLSKYGPAAVMAAVDELASHYHDLEEIGSSDVSIWTKEVIKDLESGYYDDLKEDTAYAGGMGQGGNAGQSYRKFKPKVAGTFKEDSDMRFAAEKTPAVNPYGGQKDRQFRGSINEQPKKVIKKESSVMKGLRR